MNEAKEPVGSADEQPSPEDPISIPDDTPGWALAERAAWHLMEKSARDLVVLDLRGHSDVCDFFVIATGDSDQQVKAAARHLHDALAAAGHKPKSIEGTNDGRWALLDYFDVVVHVFHTRSREYFQLERLWSEGARRDLDPTWFSDPAVAARHPDLKFTTAAGTGGAE